MKYKLIIQHYPIRHIYAVYHRKIRSHTPNIIMAAAAPPPSQPSDAPKSEVQELVEFLSNPRAEVQMQAAQLVQGLTATADGLATLATVSDTLLPSLLRLLPSARITDLATCALSSLINLSQDKATASALVDANAVALAADYLRERPPHLSPQLLIMLLANLTTQTKGAQRLVLGSGGLPAGTHIAMLVKLLLTSTTSPTQEEYAHIADVLTNITRTAEGRRVLVDQHHLPALAEQLKGQCSETRRRGAAAMLRNICLALTEAHRNDDTRNEQHPPVAGDAHTANAPHHTASTDTNAGSGYPVPTEVLAVMVGCLCGTGEQQLEPQGDIRELLAEAVLLVTQHPAGKAALWTFNAPEQLRKGYEIEEHVGVCDAMEAAARLFMAGGGIGEEEGNEGNDGEGEVVQNIVEIPMGVGWAQPQHTVIKELD